MKKLIYCIALLTSPLWASSEKDVYNKIVVTLADSKCTIPAVSKRYYVENYKLSDKKKTIIDTFILDGRKTTYFTHLDLNEKYVFKIRKQPDSTLILQKTAKVEKADEEVELYFSLCD